MISAQDNFRKPSRVNDQFDIVVIGGGAAGLMAGIFAGRSLNERGISPRVAVLDGAKKIGAKILISGGGRCNVTHDVVEAASFFGDSRNSIAKVLRTFTVDDTVKFFGELGVVLKREEGGKLFPVSDTARTILDALVTGLRDSGVALLPNTRVTAIRRDGSHFMLDSLSGRIIRCSTLIVATGGQSIPKSGSDGLGYELARSLGHEVTATTPALVPLLLPDGHWLTELSGISLDVELSLKTETGALLQRESGSMLLTHFGISGPVVLDMSRHWNAWRVQGKDVHLFVNLRPSQDQSAFEAWLTTMTTDRPRARVSTLLASLLPERMALLLLEFSASIPVQRRASELTRDERRRLARTITDMQIPVTGDRGYNFAEVTAGGVPLSEVELSTMKSRRCSQLYLCGEILNVDGRIGGYNFQWAWTSGRLAGISAASCREPQRGD